MQIGDENVHRAGMAMDEIFGAGNRVATISYATTGGSSANTLPQVADYLLWYVKDRKCAKYRQLYEPLTRAEIIDYFNWDVMVELSDGLRRKPTPEERFDPDRYLPKDARIYQRMPLSSRGLSTTGRSDPYEWNGRVFHCPVGQQWRVSKEGMDRLAELGRLEALEGQTSLRWKKYEDEVPGRQLHNIWAASMSADDKRYVVQTAIKVIQRAILMTTDPGDLVFDPTCGSGTTAHVAEQWGRRWITCDTSRVAIAIARQRLMAGIMTITSWPIPTKDLAPASATVALPPSRRGPWLTTSRPTKPCSTTSRIATAGRPASPVRSPWRRCRLPSLRRWMRSLTLTPALSRGEREPPSPARQWRPPAGIKNPLPLGEGRDSPRPASPGSRPQAAQRTDQRRATALARAAKPDNSVG